MDGGNEGQNEFSLLNNNNQNNNNQDNNSNSTNNYLNINNQENSSSQKTEETTKTGNINNNTEETINPNTENNDNINNTKRMKQYNEMKELNDSCYFNLMKKGNIIDVCYHNRWMIGKIEDFNKNTGEIKIDLIEKNNSIPEYEDNYYQNQNNFSYFRSHTTIGSNNYIEYNQCIESEIKKKFDFLKKFKKLKNDFSEKNLISIFEKEDPYYYFQLFNFYLLFDIDYFLNSNNNKFHEETCKYIKIILEIISNYYSYIAENFQLYIQYINNKDTELEKLFLVDINSAILYFFNEIILIFKKISGTSYVSNFLYYNKNQKSLLKIYNKYYDDKLLERNCIIKKYKETFEYQQHTFTYNVSFFAIDYFIAIKGIQNLLNLIIQLNEMDLKNFYEILKKLIYFTDYCNKIYELYPQELEIIFKIIRNKISKSEKLDEQLIRKIFQTIKYLCENKKKANQIFDDLYITYLFTKFTNGDFSQKLDIITELNNIIQSINYNEEIKYLSEIKDKKKNEKKRLEIEQKYSNRNSNINELSKTLFTQHLYKFNILDKILFSKSLHISILSLSEPIIEMMYVNKYGLKDKNEINTLNEKLINTLCLYFENSKKNDEMQDNKIYGKIICKLIKNMKREDKINLYNKFKIYFKNISNLVELEFLIKFTFNMIDFNYKESDIDYKNNNPNFNIDYYFSLDEVLKNFEDDLDNKNIQFKNEENSFIADELSKFLLKEENCSNLFREKIIFYSFLNINGNHNVVQNINLLNLILNSFKNKENIKPILQNIQKKKKETLFSILTKNFFKFLSKIKELNLNNENNLDTIISGSYTINDYICNFKELAFLLLTDDYYEKNDKNTLNCFNSIFQNLNDFNFIKNSFYNDLYKNLDDLNQEIKNFIYKEEDLFKIDSLSSFNLYKQIFLSIKKEKNNIFYYTIEKFRVNIELPFDMGQIWNALNNNNNEDVQRELIKFITYIYYNPTKFNEEKSIKFWKKIAEDLKINFQKIMKEKESENNDKIILGYLKLIKNLLNNFGKYERNYYDQIIDRNYRYQLQRFNSNNKNKKNKKDEINYENEKWEQYSIIQTPKFEGGIKVYNSQKFYEIRLLVGKYFHVDDNKIKFYINAKDSKTKAIIKKYYDLNYDFENFNNIFSDKSFF
jgi:hypothetical protein